MHCIQRLVKSNCRVRGHVVSRLKTPVSHMITPVISLLPYSLREVPPDLPSRDLQDEGPISRNS